MSQTGRGSAVAVKATGDTSYTVFGIIMSVDGINKTIGEVESTLLSSNFKPYLPTIPEGELTLNVRHNYADPGYGKVKTAMSVPVQTLHWQITYQDGYVDTFDGFPKGYSITGVENETVVNAAIPVRLTTDVTSTAPG